MSLSAPTYLYLNFTCNLDCQFCASDKTNTAKHNRWFTLKQIKEIFDDHYFSRYPSTRIFVSGGEPTVHPEFLSISRFLATRFESIYLMTNGVKLSDKVYLDSTINSGILNFSTPLYGDQPLHDGLTRGKSYDKTYKFLTSIQEMILGAKNVSLDVKLLFMKQNYECNPSLMRDLLSEFGGSFSYSLNGLFRSTKAISSDSYFPFSMMKKEVTAAITALKEAHLPIRLSFVPLCSIERSLLREILLELYIATITSSDQVYYVRPDSRKVRLFSNSKSENKKCKSCDVYEICTKFTGINERLFETDDVDPVRL